MSAASTGEFNLVLFNGRFLTGPIQDAVSHQPQHLRALRLGQQTDKNLRRFRGSLLQHQHGFINGRRRRIGALRLDGFKNGRKRRLHLRCRAANGLTR